MSNGNFSSVQVKVDYDFDSRRHRLTVEGGRTEAPAIDRLNRFLVQTHAQTFANMDVVGTAIFPNH